MTEQPGKKAWTKPPLLRRCAHFIRNAKAWVIILGAALAGMAGISAGQADQADAKRLLKAMSDYMGAQKTISFDYDVNLELVSTQQQKIGLASSGTVTLNRPDNLHLTRTGSSRRGVREYVGDASWQRIRGL